jgi:hypothetical protein
LLAEAAECRRVMQTVRVQSAAEGVARRFIGTPSQKIGTGGSIAVL